MADLKDDARSAGSWQFDNENFVLSSGDRSAQLTRKTGQVLACLLRHKGEIVPQDQILHDVWPDLHVTPDLVREYVSDLRTLLEDDARMPRVIETLRGRGYRLIGDVRETARREPLATSLVRIAVLGLADRSLDARWTRLAEGLSDEIASELSRYPDMAVISRPAAAAMEPGFNLRELTERLGVRYAVVGTVSIAGDRIKALIDLVDGQSGAIRWTRRYDRPPTELPGLIEDVSGGVAGALGGILGEIQRLERQLVRRKPLATLGAYEHYLLGCDAEARHDREGTFQALDHIERALAEDPCFARCWLVLGWICNRIRTHKWSDDPKAWERREHEAIERALACDSRDPLALADAALCRALEGREAQALALIERAVDLVGNQADACVFLSFALAVTAGDGPRALAFVDRGLALNPEPPDWYSISECRAAFYAGEYSRSIAASRIGVFADFLANQVYTLLSLAELGCSEEAAELWLEMIENHPTFDFESYASETPITHRRALETYRAATTKLLAIVGKLDASD